MARGVGELGKPSLKELESKAEQVGLVHAMAFLRRISAANLADYVDNEVIRSDLRQPCASAVAEVGENKAVKKAVYGSYSRQSNCPCRTCHRLQAGVGGRSTSSRRSVPC